MFPFLTIFLIFILVLAYKLRRNARTEQDKAEAFWTREREANDVRRKDLSGLDYITIPSELLEAPAGVDPETLSCYETLRSLSGQDIVNLSDMTNTELKLSYGVANFAVLSEMGERCDTMLITMTALGRKLAEQSHDHEAMHVLAFAIRCRSDISEQYLMLAKLYRKHGLDKELSQLYIYAGLLPEGKKERLLTRLDQL